MKKDKEIIRDMLGYISNQSIDIMKLTTMLEAKDMYLPIFKTKIINEIRDRFENIEKMVITIKDRKTVKNQTKFTNVELKKLNILD